MKVFKDFINANKGFVTFGLVFIFLFAGLSKSFACKTATYQKQKVSAENQKVFKSTEVSGISGFNDQIKDSDTDADDVEFTLIFNYTTPKFFVPSQALKNFSGFCPLNNTYTIPLYDLFCNWKHCI